MKFPELTDEQKDIARKIADKARDYGIDPELALAVGWAENKFNPVGESPKGALGPMQVMPSNAKGLGLKREDLLNPEINIDAGMRILKENLDTHKGNPQYALIGYNANPTIARSFSQNNDIKSLPLETQNYLAKIGGMRDLTQTGFISQEAPAQEAPVQGAEDLSYLGALPADIDEKDPELSTTEQLYQRARELMSGPEGEVDKSLMTGSGAVAGTAVGATQAGVGLTKKIADALDTVAQNRGAGATGVDANSPGQKYKKKTGYGRGSGYTVEDVVTDRERAKGHGKVSGKMSKMWGVPERGESLMDMLYRKQKTAEQLAKEAARNKMLDKIGFISKVPVIGPAIAGGSAGYDIADMIDRYEKGDTSGAVIKGIGGLGSLAAMVPHPLTRAVGTGLGLLSIPAGMANDYIKEKE
jgi:hypothetical protein